MNFLWFLIGAVSGVVIFTFIRNNSDTNLTAEDYRADLINDLYNPCKDKK